MIDKFRPQAIFDDEGNRYFLPRRLGRGSSNNLSDTADGDKDLDGPSARLISDRLSVPEAVEENKSSMTSGHVASSQAFHTSN